MRATIGAPKRRAPSDLPDAPSRLTARRPVGCRLSAVGCRPVERQLTAAVCRLSHGTGGRRRAQQGGHEVDRPGSGEAQPEDLVAADARLGRHVGDQFRHVLDDLGGLDAGMRFLTTSGLPSRSTTMPETVCGVRPWCWAISTRLTPVRALQKGGKPAINDTRSYDFSHLAGAPHTSPVMLTRRTGGPRCRGTPPAATRRRGPGAPVRATGGGTGRGCWGSRCRAGSGRRVRPGGAGPGGETG
ncbi:hypothetical protein QFZ66_000567 [Streptomyces sp. B4I13]|nr:hypothetical protein [Streptomyces sp. B4I13]